MSNEERLHLASKVNFLALQSYLRITGWVKQQSKSDTYSIFRLTDTNEIVLPLNKLFADYDSAILNAVRKISEIEQRKIDQVLADIILPIADVLRFRLVSRDTETGTITFDDGFNLLENARLSLYTSACDVISPSKYHKRLAFAKADTFIKTCRLGQTERGSFIASVICPFIDEGVDSSQLSFFSPSEAFTKSFTRKVTRNLLTSIREVKKSIENQSTEELLNPDREEIISANFLQAIVNISELKSEGTTDLEITPSWAPVGDVLSLPKSVSISPDYLPPLKTLIKQLTPQNEVNDGEFVGRISSVKADPDFKNRTEGEVLFNFLGDDDKVVKARVILNAQDYQQACEAHEFGKNVRIRGMLISTERMKYIENATFEVLK